jgi:hypothetical protein
MDLRQADDDRRLGIDRPADDTLRRADEGASGKDRIVPEMRHGGMRAEARKPDLDRRHLRADAGRDRPQWQARPIVDGIHRLDREALEPVPLRRTPTTPVPPMPS